MVETGGFEPPNPEGADLQSAAFSHFATSPHHGADYRNRTYNLLITNQLLCQLSSSGRDSLWPKNGNGGCWGFRTLDLFRVKEALSH